MAQGEKIIKRHNRISRNISKWKDSSYLLVQQNLLNSTSFKICRPQKCQTILSRHNFCKLGTLVNIINSNFKVCHISSFLLKCWLTTWVAFAIYRLFIIRKYLKKNWFDLGLIYSVSVLKALNLKKVFSVCLQNVFFFQKCILW